MKQIMIDSSTVNTLILILKKKVHRFLFRFMSTQERKLWKIVRVALVKWKPEIFFKMYNVILLMLKLLHAN